jgi:hypothetical protein
MWWVYVLQSVPDAVTEHPVFGSEQVPHVPFAWLLEQLFIPHEVGPNLPTRVSADESLHALEVSILLQTSLLDYSNMRHLSTLKIT